MRDTTNDASTVVYLKNLPFSASVSDVLAFANQFGNVRNVRVPFDNLMQRPRGFAFVECATAADAQTLVRGLNEADFQGRRIYAELARPREARA